MGIRTPQPRPRTWRLIHKAIATASGWDSIGASYSSFELAVGKYLVSSRSCFDPASPIRASSDNNGRVYFSYCQGIPMSYIVKEYAEVSDKEFSLVERGSIIHFYPTVRTASKSWRNHQFYAFGEVILVSSIIEHFSFFKYEKYFFTCLRTSWFTRLQA